MGAPIVERKRKPDGTLREYPCTLAFAEPGLVVVRYRLSGEGGFATPVPFPPGSTSDGYFWAGRHYNVYRVRAPGGTLLAHRVDAVDDVRIALDTIDYRDLVLDWWLLPGGLVLAEDAEELEEAVAAGLLTATEHSTALEVAQEVESGGAGILAEVAAIEARAGLAP